MITSSDRIERPAPKTEIEPEWKFTLRWREGKWIVSGSNQCIDHPLDVVDKASFDRVQREIQASIPQYDDVGRLRVQLILQEDVITCLRKALSKYGDVPDCDGNLTATEALTLSEDPTAIRVKRLKEHRPASALIDRVEV